VGAALGESPEDRLGIMPVVELEDENQRFLKIGSPESLILRIRQKKFPPSAAGLTNNSPQGRFFPQRQPRGAGIVITSAHLLSSRYLCL
jgi:hypothetical protein